MTAYTADSVDVDNIRRSMKTLATVNRPANAKGAPGKYTGATGAEK